MTKRLISFLGLFTSFSTLFCCALPAAFLILGFGGAFASILNIFPQLIWFSEHKVLVLSVGAVILLMNLVLIKFSSAQSCPIDAESFLACEASKKFSKVILILSAALYLIGAFFSLGGASLLV